MKTLSESVQVQRLGDKIVVSSTDEDLFNDAIRRFEREGAELAFVANLRGTGRFTAILKLNDRAAGSADPSA